MGPFSPMERALLERIVPFAEFCFNRILDHSEPSVPDRFGLTDRECEIVQLVCNGLSNKEICRKLGRSEEHTSELQSLMRISYAVFCLKTKQKQESKKSK